MTTWSALLAAELALTSVSECCSIAGRLSNTRTNRFPIRETGTEEENNAFCTTGHKVIFPMFGNASAKDRRMAPLHADLVSEEYRRLHAGGIKWNFRQFLVDRNGIVRNRFGSCTKTLDPKIVQAIEAALTEPAS